MKVECLYDKLVPISELKKKFHPKNRNRHPEDQIKRLGQILEYQGVRYPVKISKESDLITSGHGRILAAELLGWKKFPVNYQSYDSDEQEYADVQADNAIAAWSNLDLSGINQDLADLGPDFDINLIGIKDFVIEPAEKFEAQCDEDEIPEIKESFVKPGDVWQLGKHRLMCGDSTLIDDVEKLMNNKKADLWIADPPFGVSYMEKNAAVSGGIVKNQKGKEIKSDTKSVEELSPFWRDVASNAFIVTTPKASNYWCACQGSDKMMMMMMMDEAGWNIRHELIWCKNSFVLGRSDYHYRHEPIIYGWKKNGTHNWYGGRKQDSVFEIARPRKSDLHPTTKPIELFEKLFLNSSKSNDLIYESFGGSGTSIIASEKNNRRCNTMELDPHYCQVIIERWQKYTGKIALNLSAPETIAAVEKPKKKIKRNVSS